MIIGLGFIQRTDDSESANSLDNVLRKLDYMPVSERDLHELLAEAILVGKSNESTEIMTGLETNNNTSGHNPFWHKSRLFLHVTNSGGPSQASQGLGNSVQKSLKEKLAAARGQDQALKVMEDALLTYLSSSLKVRDSSMRSPHLRIRES